MYTYSSIRHVHLEISTRCNAACPGCPRNLCGVDVIDDFPLHDMRLDEAKKIFTPTFLTQLEIIHINGNLGDFVTARDGIEIIEYFRESNPRLNIKISTNGGTKPLEFWVKLAKLGVHVIFGIDGLSDTHSLYRQQTKFDVVIENAKSFINAGGCATWKMIRFNHNEHQVEECRNLSDALGFFNFELVDHGRDAFPVFDQKGKHTHSIGNHTQPTDFEKILWIRFEAVDSNRQITLPPSKISCESKAMSSIYVTATGEIYPCCYLGFYPRNMYMNGNAEVANILPQNNNALDIGIEQAMLWFNKVEKSWDSHQLFHCINNCSIK